MNRELAYFIALAGMSISVVMYLLTMRYGGPFSPRKTWEAIADSFGLSLQRGWTIRGYRIDGTWKDVETGIYMEKIGRRTDTVVEASLEGALPPTLEISPRSADISLMRKLKLDSHQDFSHPELGEHFVYRGRSLDDMDERLLYDDQIVQALIGMQNYYPHFHIADGVLVMRMIGMQRNLKKLRPRVHRLLSTAQTIHERAADLRGSVFESEVSSDKEVATTW